VKAVIAESYERIHRSNLVGMGVLPLQFKKGQNRSSLGITGIGHFDIEIPAELKPGMDIKVHVKGKEGEPIDFLATCRNRYAGGDRILPQWRNPSDGAANILKGSRR